MSFWQDFWEAGKRRDPSEDELKPDGKNVIRDELNGVGFSVRICPHRKSYLECDECLDLTRVRTIDMTSKPRFLWTTFVSLGREKLERK